MASSNMENAFEIYEDYIKSVYGGHGNESMAVAIKYDDKKNLAPVVSAKGSGLLARRMLDIAKDYDIPIISDSGSIEELMSIKFGSEIPYTLYEVLSVILVHVYQLNKK